MTTTSPTVAPELVTLRGGFSVSLAALQILWSLEDRQFEVWVVTGQGLTIRPRSRLTHEDDAAIRQHRDELIQLVRYCTEDVQ